MFMFDCGKASAVTRGQVVGACFEIGNPPFTHWGPVGPFCPFGK